MIQEQRNWYISIGETAKMLGIHVKTIRRWEKKGLLKEAYRTVGGHKRYRYEKVRTLLTEIVRTGKITIHEKPFELPDTTPEEEKESHPRCFAPVCRKETFCPHLW